MPEMHAELPETFDCMVQPQTTNARFSYNPSLIELLDEGESEVSLESLPKGTSVSVIASNTDELGTSSDKVNIEFKAVCAFDLQFIF